jgi:hypothetical protein
MPRDDLWRRDQLLLALRLYMRLPFGKLHKGNPEIIRLANQIGRTSNALTMKACNFASLDPALQARGIRGLKNLSDADRAIWNEFSNNPEALAADAEEAASRVDLADSERVETDYILRLPTGETDIERIVRARRVQSFFRAAVLTTYGSRCALSGISTGELLNASHIIPWRESIERRADPRNGICLNAIFDRAFDRGLFTFDDNFRVVISPRLGASTVGVQLACSLDQIAGRTLILPERFPPDPVAIQYHRTHVFSHSE